jgi:hypothetical protein
MLQIINETASLLFALILGLRAYTYFSKFYYIVFYQLVTWILFYLLSYAVTYYQSTHGLKQNNLWVINLGFFVEITLLILSIRVYFDNKVLNFLLGISWGVFFTSFLIETSHQSIHVFANKTYIIGGFLIISLFSYMLYKIFSSENSNPFYNSKLWVCAGLVLFYACNIPYLSVINYLNINYPNLSSLLFKFITDILANLRYLFLGVSFWLLRHSALKLTQNTHAQE